MLFSEHPHVICKGVEADDCNLSGYIHIYINGRTGGAKILYGKKYKYSLYYQKHCLYNSDIYHLKMIVFEH